MRTKNIENYCCEYYGNEYIMTVITSKNNMMGIKSKNNMIGAKGVNIMMGIKNINNMIGIRREKMLSQT